jgi:hypothetical protein
MHPNLRKVDNEDVREVLRLTAPFLTVIPPDSPVSTYALLESADRVLTFGSSAGIEAVYWGTPSILAGHSLYRELGGTYNPASHDELVTLLKSDLPPKDKTPALMFGYYYATYGMPYRYYRATSVTHGTFREQPLPRPYLLGELARKAKRVGRYLSGSRG